MVDFKLSVRLETDWGNPDAILTHRFSANSWKEAERLSSVSISYTADCLKSALNGEYENNRCINHEFTPWPEMAWHVREMLGFLRKGSKPPVIMAELEVVSQSKSIDIGKEFYRQSKILRDAAELKEAEMAMLNHKAKLSRLGGELK